MVKGLAIYILKVVVLTACIRDPGTKELMLTNDSIGQQMIVSEHLVCYFCQLIANESICIYINSLTRY